jgi:hypothetical protein
VLKETVSPNPQELTMPNTPTQPTQPPKPQAPPPQPPKPAAAKPPADPQEAKLEAFKRPEVNLHPDGPTSAEEQRARSAEIEAQGMAKYLEAIDQRPAEERANKQVPGVVPPTKRE